MRRFGTATRPAPAPKRIARSVLMSAAFGLFVVGCSPEPLDDSDGGVGGSATGGRRSVTGGSATGGSASVPVCATVESLPSIDTACSTSGESQCDATGNRCVCDRAGWSCSTICASTYPTEPTPDSACISGAVCNYPSGVTCECFRSRWTCIGTSSCPAAAEMPVTGDDCRGLAGVWCNYPSPEDPGYPHMACFCDAKADSSAGAGWVCMQLGSCPTAQPPYDLTTTCSGVTICGYGSTYCYCPMAGGHWRCGFGLPSPVIVD